MPTPRRESAWWPRWVFGGQRNPAACCVQKRVDFPVDWVLDGTPLPPHLAASACSASQAGLPARQQNGLQSPGSKGSRAFREDEAFAEEVAWQIATDRQQQLFEAASLIPVLYDVRAPELDEPQHTATAVHRKTQVARKLATFQKPLGAGAQERLQSYILALQRLSACSDAVAKVFEVFEDYMDVHLLLEHCSGGTIYERILERQYFTEQESAMLIKHMLQALAPFHEAHLYHGNLTPDSFRFLNDSPHSPLKLIEFGIELKVHRWDAMEHVSGGPDPQNPRCPQFFETCKLVFCAPEVAPPHQPKRKAQQGAAAATPAAPTTAPDSQEALAAEDLLDGDLLADVLDEHADWLEEQQQEESSCDYNKKFEAADIWSVGAIAFLLLCGYPPFFAPSRNAILGRIHRGEISFDPPFWSKISEEAKSFVDGCLKQSCWDRMSVQQALEHPWIQRLADTSPSGAMFTSFMLNLRRFYRTSLIEMYVANMLAVRFRREDMHDFLRRCREIDMCSTGFFTASDLKHVLNALGHGMVAEAITARFLRAFRHPGESYIDYIAMLDSIYLRQQRIFEEELWRHFQRVCQSSCRGSGEMDGWLAVAELGMLFSDPVIVGLLMHEIPESAGVEEAAVCQKLQSSIRQYSSERRASRLEIRVLAPMLLRLVREYGAPRDPAAAATRLAGRDQPEFDVLETMTTIL